MREQVASDKPARSGLHSQGFTSACYRSKAMLAARLRHARLAMAAPALDHRFAAHRARDRSTALFFDPFEYDPLEVNPPKPVMATLADDLHDIYGDLLKGLVIYRAAKPQNALWQWHFTYYAHWGRHPSRAQSAIWQHLSEGNWA